MRSCINVQKISLPIPSVHFSNTVNFKVPSPEGPHPFLTMTTPIFVWNCTSMQKISCFYLFFLQIQSILESRDQTGHSTFNFCEFVWTYTSSKAYWSISTLSLKAYWSILKTFLNNKKIPCIPPIYHNNNYITDFKEKAQIFNDFFAKQCTLVENSSKLPTNSFKRTNNLLSTILFTKDDIAKIIKNLNPNKAHGFDMISIHMIKICNDSILKLF